MCGKLLSGCAVLVLVLVAGCVHPLAVQQSGAATTSGVQPPSAAPGAPPEAPAASPPANAGTSPVVHAPPAQPPEKPTRVPAPAGRAAAVTSAAPGGASPAKNPSRPPSPAAAAPLAPPAQPAVPGPPALDLGSLEQRLRDTHAIGVFTKLSLKNQVDDLLAQFKAFHRGQSTIALATLRQHFELLLLKVVSLLQNGDAQLAAAVSSSREAIWTVLVDPVKFAQL